MSSFEQIRQRTSELLNDGRSQRRTVLVQRWDLTDTLMQLYSEETDIDVTMQHLYFDFDGEMASDFGGVSREVYSSFWKESSLNFFEGNDNSFVPRCGGISKEAYITLGKIIHHGFLLTGIFPVCLNQAYIQAMLMGEDSLSDDFLLKQYIDFLSSYEGSKLSGILESPKLTEDDRDFIIDLEDRYGMRSSPSVSTVGIIALQMARSELLEVPMHTMAKVKRGMTCNQHGKLLWESISARDIDGIYQVQCPTPSKVSSLLRSEEEYLSEDKAKVFEYVRRYVKSSDTKKCQAFLKYCTGSNTIVVDKITLTFFKSAAKEALPKAHTCGAVLEMPLGSYPTYNFFKTLLDSLLDNPLAYQFRFG